MKPITVLAAKSGSWWAASVPSMPGVHTQARSLAAVPAMAAEAIALVLDVDPAVVEIDLQPAISAEAAAAIRRAHGLQDQAVRLRDEAAAASRDAARALIDEGLSQTDAANVLGVSFQRVHQLLT